MARKAKAARKRTDTVKLNLRLSEWLRYGLAREAKKQNRSLNTEIVTRLEYSLLRGTLHDPAVFNATLGELLTLFLKELEVRS
jgi:hypothetical protein